MEERFSGLQGIRATGVVDGFELLYFELVEVIREDRVPLEALDFQVLVG